MFGYVYNLVVVFGRSFLILQSPCLGREKWLFFFCYLVMYVQSIIYCSTLSLGGIVICSVRAAKPEILTRLRFSFLFIFLMKIMFTFQSCYFGFR